MQAIDKPFTRIIGGNKQFIIPVFQRDYSWTKEQCKQMWKDVLRASKRKHFMGSFVYVESDSRTDFQSWLVIDGQQRLTTLTLLLIALRDHIADSGWVGADEDSPTTNKINDFYLKNHHEEKIRYFKLVLRRTDNATLQALVSGTNLSELSNNHSVHVAEAYQFFRVCLKQPECDLEELYKGIGQLEIVDVKLVRDIDNPQLVFESMNSTGVNLNQSDLVRNYLLMGLNEPEQTRLYEEYWCKIESLFPASPSIFDSFLRDYVDLETRSTQQTHTNGIYDAFKEFWNPSSELTLEELLKDMVRVARNYASFRGTAPMQLKWLSDAMNNLRSLHTTQGLLIMRLYDCHENQQLSNEEFVDAVTLIESYLLRRAVVGLDTRSYWSIFARIAHDIDRQDTFESLKIAFARLRDNLRFPTDIEFKRRLEEHDLYELRVCRHILDRLENANQKEESPVGDYTIEHIMPRRIDDVPEWQEMLGDDWQNIHGFWLHRLGNLTLTAYNSTYSNLPFDQKKEIEGGFNQSAVRLNQYVRNKEQWTAVQMQERGKQLAEQGLKIWPHHQADEAQIQEADVRNLRLLANLRSSDELEINSDVRNLLQQIQESVRELGDIIEVIENRSVCCYGPGFFAELLPMSNRVRIILPLDYNEKDNHGGLDVIDASDWKFVPNRMHGDCDLLVDIGHEAHIEAVMPMIRHAFNRA